MKNFERLLNISSIDIRSGKLFSKRKRVSVIQRLQLSNTTLLHYLENSQKSSSWASYCCWVQMDFTPALIFVGHFLKEFYSKFNSILNASLSLVKLLEISCFDKYCFLFTIDFKSLYTNFPVDDATILKASSNFVSTSRMSFQMPILSLSYWILS